MAAITSLNCMHSADLVPHKTRWGGGSWTTNPSGQHNRGFDVGSFHRTYRLIHQRERTSRALNCISCSIFSNHPYLDVYLLYLRNGSRQRLLPISLGTNWIWAWTKMFKFCLAAAAETHTGTLEYPGRVEELSGNSGRCRSTKHRTTLPIAGRRTLVEFC